MPATLGSVVHVTYFACSVQEGERERLKTVATSGSGEYKMVHGRAAGAAGLGWERAENYTTCHSARVA